MNYKKDSEPDPNQLDIEWIRQPELYRKYAEKLQEAKDELRRAIEYKKTIRSVLILETTKDPMNTMGTWKLSDTRAEAYYRSHKKYKKAIENVLYWEKEVGLLEVATITIFQKKAALENLVMLLGQRYFAAPREPRNLNKEFQKFKLLSKTKRKGIKNDKTK